MIAMMAAAVLAPVAIMTVFQFGAAEAERWLRTECAAHQAQLETLRARSWPDTPAVRRIATLAERLGPETAKRMRRYWELQTWLVVQAEETLIEEAVGDASVDEAEVRSAFAELDGLRRALGRSSFAALKALLPFSRNDYWEISELRQRL
jgi:hypothetical protein